MPSLAVIIVSWNTRDLLRRCLDTAHASLAGAGIAYQVIVVDNASSDGTPAMLRAAHPEVVLIEAGRNLGFAGGNNLALRRVLSAEFRVLSSAPPNSKLKRSEDTRNSKFDADPRNLKLKTQHSKLDYILLLNPDAEVVGDAIPRLVGYMDAHPDVAVAGPKLLYPDGSAQPSRRRFPSRGVFFWESTPLEARWPGNPWARRYRCADAPDDITQDVDWLVGAALLVRREAIERAGLLDAGFAMYSEELEWQRRIRRPTTDDRRPTTDDRPPTTDDRPPTTDETSTQHATRNTQH
ncbi:MAG: glycosyltransferase family 2 protein, partial [Roseiflexaceae bacterium]